MPFDFAAVDSLSFAAHGLMPLPWWGYVVVAVVLTHVTIACVTIFLHRAQAHRALDLAPIVSHFFRFWLWLTTGMVTKEWVAIHRKHHARVETPDDPHSPQTRGIKIPFPQREYRVLGTEGGGAGVGPPPAAAGPARGTG